MKPRLKRHIDHHPVGPHQKKSSRSVGLPALIMPLASRFRVIILLVMALSGIALWAIPKIVIQNDLMFMLPEHNAAKSHYLDAEELFGNAGGIAIAITSPEGIYQIDLLDRVREFGTRCRSLNLRIPARQLSDRFGLSAEQSLALAGLLQSLSSDPEFTPRMLSDWLTAPDELAETLNDSLPSLLTVEDPDTFCKELADRLSTMARSNPSLAGELVAFARQTTDRRGHVHGSWVDDVISLTETDTVWPEFTDYTGIATAMAPFGLEAGPDLSRFADTLLETGAIHADAILAFRTSTAKPADISSSFRDALAQYLTPEAARAMSEALAAAPKQIRVGDLIPRKITADAMAHIRQRLHAWSFFQEGIYSQDEKSVLVVVRTTPNLDQPNRELLLDAIKTDVHDLFGDGRYPIHMAGYSVVDQAVANNMRQDIVRLFPLVFGVVTLFLFFTFRNPAGVLYPMFTILLAVIWCLGAMALLDVPLSVVGTAMPVLLVAVGSAYGIHLVYYFVHRHAGTAHRREAMADTLDGTGRGVVMAGLTTVAGFASLVFNDIVPLRDFGMFTALGVFFALLVSLVLIPSLLIRFGVRAPERQRSHSAVFDGRLAKRAICGVGRFSSKHPRGVLMVSVLVLLGSVTGLAGLRVEMNNIAFFKADTPIHQADTFINRNFAGTVDIRVIFSASEANGVLNPLLLDAMERLGDTIQQRHPEVGKTLSILDLIRKMNQAFYFNDPAYYRIPTVADLAGERTTEALKAHLASYIDKYQRSDTRAFIDGDKRQAALMLQVKTASSQVTRQILRSIDELLKGPVGQRLGQMGVRVHTTGIGALYVEAEHLIVNGQLRSIAVSVVIVLVLVALIMRSFIYGFLSILPLTVAICINFGVMGLLDIPLDAATAISACVAIGIGIDYGLHYLNRYRLLRDAGEGHQEAVVHTAETTGGSICINASAVAAGFSVLMLSAFVPLVNLGFLIALTMLTSSAGSLTLLPAILSLTDRSDPTSTRHKE
ncbi:MMPL family transporter [uncultured Desulfosarcina sp.]|uniref:efflux RND transporter permease subunit n=1 Tax=uncultured Desulfosarcina sp. TaxID=218289 RepID=UPI0029C8B070|nr:MMPL family transporter [uncultured Desulfosarcina sp.]